MPPIRDFLGWIHARSVRFEPGDAAPLQAKRRLPPSVRGAADNPPEEFIANVVRDWKSPEGGKWIEVSVDRDANITVTNGRTNASKTYKE